MSETAWIWIAYLNNGSEGKSEPLVAFESEFLANLWLRGAEDSYGSGATIACLPVISASNPKPERDTE